MTFPVRPYDFSHESNEQDEVERAISAKASEIATRHIKLALLYRFWVLEERKPT